MPLYDAFGRPIISEELTREHAAPSLAGLRSVWHASKADGLTPERLARILLAAKSGEAADYLTLAEEMEERDWHYHSVLSTRKLAISGLDYTVDAPTDGARDNQITDALAEVVAGPEFVDCVDDLLDALGKGYSAVEIMWRRQQQRWTPERYVWRDPRFFRFDRETGGDLRLLDEAAPVDGLPLAPYKWIVHLPRLKTGLPIRGGLAFLVSAAYVCKSFTVADWLSFAELFGMPLRLGRYGPQATEAEIRTLLSAVANIGSDAAAVIPDSMQVEFRDAANGAGGPELFRGLAEWLDRQVSKAVLGQTMTADDGSSQSQATVHNEVRRDILRADVRQLQKTLNRDLTRAFVDLNFGPQRVYPQIRLVLKDVADLKALSESLPPFIDRGLRVEASVIRDLFSLPEPAAEAEVLEPPSAGFLATNRVAPGPRQSGVTDSVEDLRDEAMQDWEPLISPLVDPIQQLAATANSMEELRTGLDDLLSSLDPDALVRRLALQQFKARALGDASDS